MITLYQFPPAFDLPVSVSPFCDKLELYFCLTDRRYDTGAGNPMMSPIKMVPYVKLANGKKMGAPAGGGQSQSRTSSTAPRGDLCSRRPPRGPIMP
jgi:hypothetical protein